MNNIHDDQIMNQKFFGKLTVICKEKNDKGILSWKCQCECGNVVHVYTGELLRGRKSCGCLMSNNNQKIKRYDDQIMNQKIFGKLTVICKEKNDKGILSWKCQCECGNIVHIYTSSLLNGRKSCGCLAFNNATKVQKFNNLIMNQKIFGKLTVICKEHNHIGRSAWKCQCECGNIIYAYSSSLIRGRKSCGCSTIHNTLTKSNHQKILDQKFFGKLTIIHDEKNAKGKIIWKCQCECGNIIYTTTNRLLCGLHHCGCLNDSSENIKYITRNGYVIVLGHKNHPNAKSNGSILEHRLIMSQILGRPLNPKETVHHKNGNKQDNRPENLELILSRNHHKGVKLRDAIIDSIELLKLYKPESLSSEFRFPTRKENDSCFKI